MNRRKVLDEDSVRSDLTEVIVEFIGSGAMAKWSSSVLKRLINMSTKSETIKFLESVRGGPLTFGELIESTRWCDEISQAELARRMKISRAHLCDIEKGRRFVRPERAARFARELGYSVNVFVSLALQDELRAAGLNMRVHLEAA